MKTSNKISLNLHRTEKNVGSKCVAKTRTKSYSPVKFFRCMLVVFATVQQGTPCVVHLRNFISNSNNGVTRLYAKNNHVLTNLQETW
jgi:ureidoglycolate hydrolase